MLGIALYALLGVFLSMSGVSVFDQPLNFFLILITVPLIDFFASRGEV